METKRTDQKVYLIFNDAIAAGQQLNALVLGTHREFAQESAVAAHFALLASGIPLDTGPTRTFNDMNGFLFKLFLCDGCKDKIYYYYVIL